MWTVRHRLIFNIISSTIARRHTIFTSGSRNSIFRIRTKDPDRQFLEALKEKDKMSQEKEIKFMETLKEKDKMFFELLAHKDEEKDELLKKQLQMALIIRDKEHLLTTANTELLRLRGRLQPRGAMEQFEADHFPDKKAQSVGRAAKYARFFRDNVGEQVNQSGFRSQLIDALPAFTVATAKDGTINQVSLDEKARFAGKMAEDVYKRISDRVHLFEYGTKVVINANYLAPDQVKFLEIICRLLQVRYEVAQEDRVPDMVDFEKDQ